LIFSVLGSSQDIFQQIGTKFPTELKLSSSPILYSVVNEPENTNFRDVQIPISVSISALWNDFHHILHAAQKHGRFDAYCW